MGLGAVVGVAEEIGSGQGVGVVLYEGHNYGSKLGREGM